MRKKRELHDDLPPRSDPNYMRLYSIKNRELVREHGKKWRKKKLDENPNYYKEKYNRDYQLDYYSKNKNIILEKKWKSCGITGINYQIFLEEVEKQKNKCKICGREMDKPQVDHDHKTGKYRGLLCVPCNNGLGVYE